ncbi:MAG TPA: DUF3300 domain-containing protein [Phycisphaerae bacterium]|nr:DUF3300 domain-containing protein [Phycisphaerae bacterium]
MITGLAKNYRSRLLLVAALVLTISTNILAQDSQEVLLVDPEVDPAYAIPPQDDGQNYVALSPQELDDLLGPVALYPDPLLAQVLAAATYPMDIVQAARFLNSSSDLSQLEQMGLDPSVQALARFPDLLKRMDEELEWTNAIGAAFLNQQQDVMDAVQRLRAQAMASGALQDTPQQEVYVEEEFVGILPADPQIIYVPQYVPEVVYGWVEPPIGGYYSSISFGFGCHTGSWLHLGFNWGSRCLAYRPWHFGHHGYHRGGFGRAYYRHGEWGRNWHRRSGSALPRFRGGGHRGGRDFSALRSGFGRRSGGGTRGGFAEGSGGPRRGFGDNFGSGPGAGSGNGPRRGQGRGGSDSGFGNGPRASQNRGPLGGFSNGPRSGERDGAMPGTRRGESRTGQSRGGSPGGFGLGQPGRRDGGGPGAIGGSGNRGGIGGGRSPTDDSRGGLFNGGRPYSRNGGNIFRGDSNPLGRSPSRQGEIQRTSRGIDRPGGLSGAPRSFGGGSSGGGITRQGSLPRRSYGGGSLPRSIGRSGFGGADGMRGLSGGGQSRGGSAFRGGGSSSSGPRISSRSGGTSMRSPGGSSPRGIRSSGMRGGGSRGGGMRGSGMRGGGGGRRGR